MDKKLSDIINLGEETLENLKRFEESVNQGYHEHLIKPAEKTFLESLNNLYKSKDPCAEPLARTYDCIYTRILLESGRLN